MSTVFIQEPVSFDGAILRVGNVKLMVEYCEIEGDDLSFTAQYGLLLLKEETKTQAQQLLHELNVLPLTDNAKKMLLRQAYDKGFQLSQLDLERYKQFSPIDQPKFYAEIGYNKQVDSHVISLVTSEKALRFYASVDLNTVTSRLPHNVYRSCMTFTGFSLTTERYLLILGHEQEFFTFVDELTRYSGYVRGDTCSVCFRKFFEDTGQAYDLLKAIRSKVSGRECRDQLFQTLERNGYIEFSSGLFVRSGWSTYYVSNNGEVQRLCYSKKVEMREAVLKANEKGKLPTKLEAVTDDITLKRIADIVGKTRPELTLLILP
jgi:hypothetical protein